MVLAERLVPHARIMLSPSYYYETICSFLSLEILYLYTFAYLFCLKSSCLSL